MILLSHHSVVFKNLTAHECRVLGVLICHADESGSTFVSLRKMAEILDMAVSKVCAALEKLRHQGLVSATFKRNGKFHRRLLLPETGVPQIREYPKKVLPDLSEVLPEMGSVRVLQNREHKESIKELEGKKKRNKEKISSSKRIYFDVPTEKIIGINKSDLDSWQAAYPDIRIDQEVLKAEQWLISNPRKRKKQILRFLTAWFIRSSKNNFQPKYQNENYKNRNRKSRQPATDFSGDISFEN